MFRSISKIFKDYSICGVMSWTLKMFCLYVVYVLFAEMASFFMPKGEVPQMYLCMALT